MDGFEQLTVAIRAAQFACGVELIDRIFAEEDAERTVAAEAGDDVFVV